MYTILYCTPCYDRNTFFYIPVVKGILEIKGKRIRVYRRYMQSLCIIKQIITH